MIVKGLAIFNDEYRILFDNVVLELFRLDNTSFSFVCPARRRDVVVSVFLSIGVEAVSYIGEYSYLSDTAAFALEPRYGPAGGTAVVFVHGVNFDSLHHQYRCHFQDWFSEASVVDSTKILCAVPIMPSNVGNLTFTLVVESSEGRVGDILLQSSYMVVPSILIGSIFVSEMVSSTFLVEIIHPVGLGDENFLCVLDGLLLPSMMVPNGESQLELLACSISGRSPSQFLTWFYVMGAGGVQSQTVDFLATKVTNEDLFRNLFIQGQSVSGAGQGQFGFRLVPKSSGLTQSSRRAAQYYKEPTRQWEDISGEVGTNILVATASRVDTFNTISNANCFSNNGSPCVTRSSIALVDSLQNDTESVRILEIAAFGQAQSTMMTIDSVVPTQLNPRNETWVSVQGRYFTIDTLCVVNGHTPVPSSFINANIMECLLPPQATTKTGIVTLSLQNSWSQFSGNNISLTYLNNPHYVKYLQRLSLAPVTGIADKGAVDSTSVCLTADCNQRVPIESACQSSDLRWVAFLNSQYFQGNSSQLSLCNTTSFKPEVAASQNVVPALPVVSLEIGSIYYVQPSVIFINSSVTTLNVYGSNFSPAVKWCSEIDGVAQECYRLSTYNLVCPLQMQHAPGNYSMNILSNCTHFVGSLPLSVQWRSARGRNTESTMRFEAMRWNSMPSVTTLSPSSGAIGGGTLIRIEGDNLVEVLSCKFSLQNSHSGNKTPNDDDYYVVPAVVSSNGTWLTCVSPAVSHAAIAQLSLNCENLVYIDIPFTFRFYPIPVLYSTAQLSTPTLKRGLDIFGEMIPVNSRSFCKVDLFRNYSMLMVASVITSQLVHCQLASNAVSDFEVAVNLWLSFNGVDGDWLPVQPSSRAQQQQSVQWQLPAKAATHSTSSSPIWTVVPTERTVICETAVDVIVSVNTATISANQIPNNDCFFNFARIGRARYVGGLSYACTIPPQRYGRHVLDVRSQANDTVATVNVNCAPRPVILAMDILPPNEVDGSRDLAFSAANISPFMSITCVLDDNEVVASVDSSFTFNCHFGPLSAGLHNLVVRTRDLSILTSGLCLTSMLHRVGGSLPINIDASCDLTSSPVDPSGVVSETYDIRSFWPRVGSTSGDTIVEITADRIEFGDTFTCVFGATGKKVDAVVVQSGRLMCTTPMMPPTNASLMVVSGAGDVWCCGWFYFIPSIKILAVRPLVLSNDEGSIVMIDTAMIPTTNISLFCYFGSEIIAATIVSHHRVSCASPLLSGDSVTIALGSTSEALSNNVQVPVVSAEFPLQAQPGHGSIHGGTSVVLTLPHNLKIEQPSCLFGGVRSTVAFFELENVLICETPAAHVGWVEVGVQDASFSQSPIFGFGMFFYELPADIATISPTSVNQGQDVTFVVHGSFLRDSASLACVVNNGRVTFVPGRWMSSSMMLCEVPGEASSSGSSLTVGVSNNGADISPHVVNITMKPVNDIIKMGPLVGYSNGGTDITFSFSHPFPGLLKCVFEVGQVSAFRVDARSFKCSAPPSIPGPCKLYVSDESTQILFSTTFQFIQVPSILNVLPASIVAESLGFVTMEGDGFTSFTQGRFRGTYGNVLESSCQFLNVSRIVCELTANRNDSVVFWDVSVNGNDFINNFATIVVQQPIHVAAFLPSILFDQGGQSIEMLVDSDAPSSDLRCRFFTAAFEVLVGATYSDAHRATCISPTLPMTDLVQLTVEKSMATVYGPVHLVLHRVPTVLAVAPTTITAGTFVPVIVTTDQPITTPLLQCVVGGSRFDLLPFNSTCGLCSVQMMNSGNFSFNVAAKGLLPNASSNSRFTFNVVDMSVDFRINTTWIVDFADSPIVIESPSCSIPRGSFCRSDSMVVVTLPSSSACSMNCVIIQDNSIAEFVAVQICAVETCQQPIFTSLLNVMSSVGVFALQPEVGPDVGGTLVTVKGTSFVNDASMMCKFGEIVAQALFVSSTSIQCTSPPSHPGVVPMSIVRNGIDVGLSFSKFEYIPLISHVVPNSTSILSTGGTPLAVSTEILRYPGPYLCRFQDQYVDASLINGSEILCLSPAIEFEAVAFAVASYTRSDISVVVTLAVVTPPIVLYVDPVASLTSDSMAVSILLSDEHDPDLLSCAIGTSVGVVSVDSTIVTCTCSLQDTSGASVITLAMMNSLIFSASVNVDAPIPVLTIQPLTGFWDGNTAVTFTTATPMDDSQYLSCCFGSMIVPAVVISAFEGMCYTPSAEIISSQSVPMGVMVGQSSFCADTHFAFTYFRLPLALNSSHSQGPAVGGTVIDLTFSGVLAPVMYCRIGNNIIVGQVLGGTSLLCVTKKSSPGVFDIDVSPNGVDFKSTGFQFKFLSLQQIEGSPPVQAAPPIVFFVEPTSVFAGKSQIVHMHGENFDERAVCVMGSTSIVPLDTLFVSANELQCTIPAHGLGSDQIAVQNFNSVPSLSVEIKFETVAYVQGTSSPFVLPPFGPKSQNTLITVFGANLNQIAEDIYCLIGDQWAFATDVTDTSVTCSTMPSPFSGLVEVKLATANKEFLTGALMFEYIDDPLVFDAQPARGSVGTELIVVGQGFLRLPSITCMIGSLAATTVVLSDSKVICTVPQMTPGSFSVSFETNGQHILRSGIEFSYFQQAELTSLWPLNGPALRGGTVVSIFGSDFGSIDSVDVVCLFGAYSVPAVIISDEMIKCRSPSQRLGIVNVSVLSDGVMIHPPGTSLQFAYVGDVSVQKIFPDFGYTAGEYTVFVFGNNFVNTTSLGCRFADMESRGIFLSNESIVCLAPSPLGRSAINDYTRVRVEVTVNGLDYSDSGNLFAYREPCEAGFFCPGLSREICPNGTYCPVNSRNFTSCPPGFFQPREGQQECVVCPVGYICPDLGLMRPILCPAGQICDVMGLSASDKSCPAGYYCLNTTKAVSPNAFLGDTSGIGGISAWEIDEVSGVLWFNEYAYDWNYTVWPAPAVGKSRSRHPPSSQCDGYDCLTGSKHVIAEAPFACPIGHYCRAGAVAQTPVPKNFSTPQRCFDGFFCPRGSISPEGRGPCPNGYFCPTLLDAIICPEGHYCPGVGNRAPVECYPGTYNPFPGKANCTVCPTGHICPGWGLLLPEPCPAGFVCMALGLSFPVVLCPQGYYCQEGTLTLDPSDPTELKPLPCEAGTFCLGGVAIGDITIDWIPSATYGSMYRQKCVEGTYCAEATYQSSGTGLCFPGHYCPPGSIYPTATPRGNFASVNGSVAPTMCFPGTYAPLIAQVNCIPCPSGHTCPVYGTYTPTICEAGYYRSQVDSITCRSCPTGTYSTEVGLTDLSMCFPCPKGQVCGMTTMTNLVNSTTCPAGFVCGIGTDRSRQFINDVPAGYHGDVQLEPEGQYDSYCVRGYTCPRGTPDSLQFRAQCATSSFCPQSSSATGALDNKCPIYTTSLTGSSEITNCTILPTDVCQKVAIELNNPFQTVTYLDTFSFTPLDGSPVQTYDSSKVGATQEIRVADKIWPVNVSMSSPPWVNDTIEAFRTCPSYGSGVGGDVITIIGRNFIDTGLNFCRFRACIFSNLVSFGNAHHFRLIISLIWCRCMIAGTTSPPLQKHDKQGRWHFVTSGWQFVRHQLHLASPLHQPDKDGMRRA